MMQSLFDLSGRRALVTGATRGLGLEMARGLAEAGATVHVNGRSAETARAAAERLAREGLDVRPAPFDVADAGACTAAIGALAEAGGLDILINNVGQRDRRPVDRMAAEDFERLLAVDLVAAYRLVREALPLLRASGRGRIVMVTSIAAQISRAGDPAYVAAKGGMAALTRALAAELAPQGITCNAIAPGFFATETNAYLADDPRTRPAFADRVPLGRWGRPREIAGAAVFLAADAGSYVNGHTLVVDGGVSSTY